VNCVAWSTTSVPRTDFAPLPDDLTSFFQRQATLPADLIRRLVCLTSYEDHLRRTQPDWQSRWENVQELINFASDVQLDTNDATGSGTFERPEELGIQALEESSGMHETSVEEFAEAETKCVLDNPCLLREYVVDVWRELPEVHPSDFSSRL